MGHIAINCWHRYEPQTQTNIFANHSQFLSAVNSDMTSSILEHHLHCMILYGILIVVPPIILQMIAIISPLKLLTLAANLLS